MREINIVIIGSGFFGSTIARVLAQFGLKVLILERRNHIGGNAWSEPDAETGIDVHKYGSHIFHTDNEKVWKFINQFTEFNEYRHSVWTTYEGQVYSMPINLNTINSFYKKSFKPHEVNAFLQTEIGKEKYSNPKNLEEQAISLIGRPLYEAFIKGYTIKQWEKDPRELSPEIIKRLPVRNNYNLRYFSDPYEGIPLNGYGSLFKNLLNHENITVELNTDWFAVKDKYIGKYPIVYSGPVDQFFDYKYGRLEWRSIELERQVCDVSDYQGCSVMNYAGIDVPYTRIHEFKHFHPEKPVSNKTVIFKEYSKIISKTSEPYYPVNTPHNKELLEAYNKEASALENLWIGGRLGGYRYLDMDDTIREALKLADEILAKYK